MLPALLCASATTTRHLKSSLELVTDLDDVDKARTVPYAALELQLAAVLGHDALTHLRAQALWHGYPPALASGGIIFGSS